MKCRRSVIIHSVMPKVISLLICVHSETDYNFSFYWTSLYYKHQLLFVPFPTIHESTLKWVLSKFEIFSIVLLLPNLRNSMTSCVHFALCCFCRFSPYLSSSFSYWTLCFSVLIFLFWKVVFDCPLLLSDSIRIFSPFFFSFICCYKKLHFCAFSLFKIYFHSLSCRLGHWQEGYRHSAGRSI